MHKEAYEITRYLADECGIRVAGTENLNKASKYIASKFEEYGVDNEFHYFEIPICEILESSCYITINGKKTPIDHKPALFSKEPPADFAVPLVYCEDGSIGELETKDLKGKAVLICRDSYIEYPDLNMYKRLHEYGVKAVFYTSSDGHKDIPYVYANYEFIDEDYTIPTAILLYDDAKELAQKDDIVIEYSAKFNITYAKTQNTIGTIKGSDPGTGNILVCAHLDSAEKSRGAADDAGGIGVVMMMAKLYGEMKKNGILPKRTIRFIAWSGHECGLHGSKNFVLDYPEVIDEMKFLLNYDILGNALSSPLIWAGCNEETEIKINDIVRSLDFDWNVDIGPWVVDTISFAHKGIPHLTLTSGFYAINHTQYDNMSYISEQSFVTPIKFSKKLLKWAVGDEKISAGYSDDLFNEMKFYGNMYGWGFFK